MNPAKPPVPLTEVLRHTPRGAAIFLASAVRPRLLAAETVTLAFLKMILATLIIPAEALARRVILTLAARLPAPAARPPAGTRGPQAGKRPLAPKVPSTRAPAFRMTEPLPRAGAGRLPGLAPEIRLQTKADGKAMSPEERLVRRIYTRLQAVLEALHDPDREAARFRRRLGTRPPIRAPLAFARPSGLAAAAADPVIGAALETSNRDAEAAWATLCDTS